MSADYEHRLHQQMVEEWGINEEEDWLFAFMVRMTANVRLRLRIWVRRAQNIARAKRIRLPQILGKRKRR